MMKRFFQRTISFLLIIGIVIGSGFAAAPSIAFSATEAITTDASGNKVNAQSAAYVNGVNSGQGAAKSNSTANAAGGAAGCVAGQILGQLLTSSISSAATSQVSSAASDAATMSVPTHVVGQLLDNSNAAQAARVGAGLKGVLISPSWDSIAWCVVNTIIQYLIDATIEWAKTGFNGNPAFINNPEGFFKGIADQEAGGFIQAIVGGTGINVCQPFRAQLAIGLAKAYGVNEGRNLSCSLSSIASNVGISSNGTFDYNSFFQMSQYDQNNFRGIYILGNEALGARVDKKTNSAKLEVGWSNGFLSYNHCDTVDGKKTCITDTPGTLIQSSLEKSLGIPKDRLVLAQKFDQLVTVLINSLIQVALNKVLDGSKKS